VKPYADTNFFARLYLPLPESSEVVEILENAISEGSSPLPVSWLHRVETVNAFQLYVFTSQTRGPRITREQAAAALGNYRDDISNAKYLAAAPINFEQLERQFEEISLRHTAKHGFRAYDILHVSCALLFNCDRFWSFDPKASKLAALEGLQILAVI
jgi:predicted nucleic acid-binding protein